MKKIFILTLILALLCPAALAEEESADCSLYIKAIPDLSEDFIFGMDVSSVLSLEAAGVKYYDYDGNECDLFAFLASQGINYIRVRVWVDPFDKNGNGAIVNASRSILCAGKKQEGVAFDVAARNEAIRMREDLASSLKEMGKEIK